MFSKKCTFFGANIVFLLQLIEHKLAMENLKEQFRAQLDQVDSGFIRYLHDQIEWDARLLALLGARGVGKTTLLLQTYPDE